MFGRKGDVDRALELLKNYLDWRERFKLCDFDIEKIKPAAKSGMTVFCPFVADKQGRGVTYIYPKMMKSAGTLLENMQEYIWHAYYFTDLGMDCSINYQREGYIIIEDFGGASLSDFAGMMSGTGKMDMKEAMSNVQNCIPGRIREILIIDAPWYVRILMKFAKTFMKEKMMKKVKCISHADLTQYVDADQLSKDLGGTLEWNYQEWIEQVMEARPTYLDGAYMHTNIVRRKDKKNKEHKEKKEKKDKKKKKENQEEGSSGVEHKKKKKKKKTEEKEEQKEEQKEEEKEGKSRGRFEWG